MGQNATSLQDQNEMKKAWVEIFKEMNELQHV